MRTYIILTIAIVLNALANITIKIGMLKAPKGASLGLVMSKLLFSPTILLGIALFGLALVVYSLVLAKLNLSIAYPIMTSVGFLIVILVSATFLRESITIIQMSGLVLILAGVWLVAR